MPDTPIASPDPRSQRLIDAVLERNSRVEYFGKLRPARVYVAGEMYNDRVIRETSLILADDEDQRYRLLTLNFAEGIVKMTKIVASTK
jgi:hypothetical protein